MTLLFLLSPARFEPRTEYPTHGKQRTGGRQEKSQVAQNNVSLENKRKFCPKIKTTNIIKQIRAYDALKKISISKNTFKPPEAFCEELKHDN